MKYLISFIFVVHFATPALASKTFEVVTDHNCQTSNTGALHRCRFPEILMAENREDLPVVPFETLIKVRSSRACDIGAVGTSLGLRLSGMKSDAFLAHQDFRIDRYQQLRVYHPRSYPIGRLEMGPRLPELFYGLTFPRTCRIAIEVNLNRSVLRNQAEAGEHFARIERQIEASRRTYSALLEIKNEQTRFDGLGADSGQLFDASRSYEQDEDLKALYSRWVVLMAPLQALLSSLQGDGYQLPVTRELSHLIKNYHDPLLALASATAFADEPNQKFSRLQRDLQPRKHAWITDEYLSSVADEISKAEKETLTAREWVSQKLGADSGFEQDLQDVLENLIERPQGVIDELEFRLGQIGRI